MLTIFSILEHLHIELLEVARVPGKGQRVACHRVPGAHVDQSAFGILAGHVIQDECIIDKSVELARFDCVDAFLD